MSRESFLGRNPSQFSINPIVKSYIISESFLWSAWNFITPIFAIFVVNNITGANIEIAATSFSVYLLTRVIFELISGRILYHTNDQKKFLITVIGMIFISLAYAGFALSSEVLHIFAFYAVAGAGLGIASPAKNSLFSIHLDKNKESAEWGISDASTFICMAAATALGGIIANHFGFKVLFLMACLVNLIGIVPYLQYLRKQME